MRRPRLPKLPFRATSPRTRDALGLSAAAILWIAGIVLVAVAGQAVVVQRVARTPVSTTSSDPIVSPEVLQDLPPSFTGGVTQRDADGLLGAFTATTEPDFDLGVSDPLTSGTAPRSIIPLPDLPVIELPPLPKELDPILKVLAPSVRSVCSTTGVVIVLAALVKGDLEENGIPVSQALTYLAPILSACALFPQGQPSICAVDSAINSAVIPKDLQILVGVPPLAALGLDQVDAVVEALRSTGIPIPADTSQAVADALGCDLR